MSSRSKSKRDRKLKRFRNAAMRSIGEYRLEQRLNLIDAFIKRNFRTELYLSKAVSSQSGKPIWKAIEADMTFQEHLVNLEEKRLLWKQWNRGNQTEGKPCSDIPIPHVCICDQTIVPRKKPKPKPKKVFGRHAKPIPPPEVPREPEICCQRCCKNTPTPEPTPTGTPEPFTVNSGQVNRPNRSASSSKHDSVTHLGKGGSSSLTSVEKYEDGSTTGQITNVVIESRPTSKHTNVNTVTSKNDAKASENTKSTSSLNSSKTIGNKSQVTSTVFSEGPREEASAIESTSAAKILSDGIKEGGVSRMSKNVPPGYNTGSFMGLFSMDASVNTDISYVRKPEQLENSKLKPSTPAFNLKTDPKIREMMHSYKKANKSTKLQLVKKKSVVEKETSEALDKPDDQALDKPDDQTLDKPEDQTLESLEEQEGQETASNEESAEPSKNSTAYIDTIDEEKPSVEQLTTDTESSEEKELNTENSPEHTPDETAENEDEGNKPEESSIEKAVTPVKNNSKPAKTCKIS